MIINDINKTLLYVLIFMLVLLVFVSARKYKSNFIYILKHYMLFFVEIIISSMLINLLIGGFKDNTILSFFKDFIFSYSIYQLVLLTVFKLKDSTTTDTFTAMKNYLDNHLLHLEFGRPLSPGISLNGNKISDGCRNKNHRLIWVNLIKLEKMYSRGLLRGDDYKFTLKKVAIDIEHQSKINNFFWMNSILLRIIK
ncbi:hypothetical protein PAEAM_56640 [Paenibacillus sp. GM1FR]|nr:hypothetical protein PAEAM_56640 [Paenibacillus sp. GM1FR]